MKLRKVLVVFVLALFLSVNATKAENQNEEENSKVSIIGEKEEGKTENDEKNEAKGKNIPKKSAQPRAVLGTYSSVFPDANLASEMAALFSANVSDLVDSIQLETLTTVAFDGKDIENLEGLQYLTNVTSLSLSWNKITDLTPLANLTSITSLRLPNNDIEDVAPLANLTNLQILELYDNEIENVSPLAGLSNMLFLELSQNRIYDISSLITLASNSTILELDVYDQEIILNEKTFNKVFTLTNPLVGVNSDIVAPTTISNGGLYNSSTNKITWSNLAKTVDSVEFNFSKSYPLTVGFDDLEFSGVVIQDLEYKEKPEPNKPVEPTKPKEKPGIPSTGINYLTLVPLLISGSIVGLVYYRKSYI